MEGHRQEWSLQLNLTGKTRENSPGPGIVRIDRLGALS